MKRCKLILMASLPFLVFFSYLTALSRQTTDLYVSPVGNDSNLGTVKAPLRTIQSAINKALKGNVATNVVIYLREGVYKLNESIYLKGYSGRNNLSIRNYGKEKVVITGGIQMKLSNINPLKNPEKLARISTEIRSNIVELDLDKIRIDNLENQFGWTNGSPIKPHPIEIFYMDKPLKISRWPKKDKIQIAKVLSNSGSNKTKFQFSNSTKNKKWIASSNVWMEGVLNRTWAYSNAQIKRIDFGNGEAEIFNPPLYGLNAKNFENPQDSVKGFFFTNVLEELNEPGEYYIDYPLKKIYIYLPKSKDSDFLTISALKKNLVEVSQCENVSFEGLILEYTTVNIFSMNNSKNITVKNCILRNSSQAGIDTKNITNLRLENCSVHDTGAEGIRLRGGSKRNIMSSNNIVTNCEFYNFGRIYKSYKPAISIDGVGHTVTNCYIHDSDNQGIIFTGPNHKILNNHFQNLCRMFSDIGAVYTDRGPSSLGTTIENNLFENIGQTNKNLLVSGVYIDEGSCGVIIKRNLFYKCGTSLGGAIHINGGYNNMLSDNIFYNCVRDYTGAVWSQQRWVKFIKSPKMNEQLKKTLNIQSDYYIKSFPFLKNFYQNIGQNERKNSFNNTVSINTAQPTKTHLEKQINSNYCSTTISNLNDSSIKNINLQNVLSQNTKGWKNFQPIDLAKVGIQN